MLFSIQKCIPNHLLLQVEEGHAISLKADNKAGFIEKETCVTAAAMVTKNKTNYEFSL